MSLARKEKNPVKIQEISDPGSKQLSSFKAESTTFTITIDLTENIEQKCYWNFLGMDDSLFFQLNFPLIVWSKIK